MPAGQGHVPITDFNIKIDRHIIRATDDIKNILLGITDETGSRTILCSAEREQNIRASIIRDDSPYALIHVGPVKIVKMTSAGVIIQLSAEILVHVVFTIEDGADYQAWGDGLRHLVLNALQPKTDDNPTGHVWKLPNGWRFSTDTDFSMQIDRGVRRMDDKKIGLAFGLYTIPVQFKLDIFPNTPLT